MGGWLIAAVDVGARELALFAGLAFLVGGLDDLAVDLLFFRRRGVRPDAGLLSPDTDKKFAVFVPAWDEAAVIGPMLDATRARLVHPDYRIYVGGYLNDPATLRAIAIRAADDPRVRLVINPRAGPTTKGDNLNALWRALLRDEAAGEPPVDAVVLHDAEDLVHPQALCVFDRLLGEYGVVQLPVVPLIAPDSRWVSGHYADEFAETHVRQLVVRESLGAAMPLAGVGCAIRRDTLEAIAAHRTDGPFDPDSLTEDYELGLAAGSNGARACFARVRDAAGGPVATRAFFPTTLATAARQKARWLAGIALIGWDRLGWGERRSAAELWMRMRDRRGPLAALALVAGYGALGLGVLSAALHVTSAVAAPPPSPILQWVLLASSLLVGWRMVNRMASTAGSYGWREGLRALPRAIVGNFVAILAMRRAGSLYWATLRGRAARWDKTSHDFPHGLTP